MKISLKWLRDYVDIDLEAKELADRLTMAGLEVDAIEEAGPDFDGVVVAKILSTRPHPTADKLHLCEVGTGDQILPIVCGAPNTHAGDLFPWPWSAQPFPAVSSSKHPKSGASCPKG